MKKIIIGFFNCLIAGLALLIYSKVENQQLQINKFLLVVIICCFGITPNNMIKNVKMYYVVQTIVTIILAIGLYFVFKKINF